MISETEWLEIQTRCGHQPDAAAPDDELATLYQCRLRRCLIA